MDLERLRLALLVIENRKNNQNSLYKAGFTDLEIGNIFDYCIEKGFINTNFEKFEVTILGKNEIDRLNVVLGKHNVEKKIATYVKFKEEKMTSSHIYIPKKL